MTKRPEVPAYIADAVKTLEQEPKAAIGGIYEIAKACLLEGKAAGASAQKDQAARVMVRLALMLGNREFDEPADAAKALACCAKLFVAAYGLTRKTKASMEAFKKFFIFVNAASNEAKDMNALVALGQACREALSFLPPAQNGFGRLMVKEPLKLIAKRMRETNLPEATREAAKLDAFIADKGGLPPALQIQQKQALQTKGQAAKHP
jgi:hypothetical protein